MSLPYSVAIALLEGCALPPQYQNDKLKNPEVLRLSELLMVTPDESLPRGVSCAIEVKTTGGAVITAQVDHPRGSIANPMSEDDMNRKMHLLGDPVLGAEGVDKLTSLIAKVEELPSIDGAYCGQRAGSRKLTLDGRVRPGRKAWPCFLGIWPFSGLNLAGGDLHRNTVADLAYIEREIDLVVDAVTLLAGPACPAEDGREIL